MAELNRVPVRAPPRTGSYDLLWLGTSAQLLLTVFPTSWGRLGSVEETSLFRGEQRNLVSRLPLRGGLAGFEPTLPHLVPQLTGCEWCMCLWTV